MKHIATTLLAAALAAAGAGCRQQDVRAAVVRVPQASDARSQEAVLAALRPIDGVFVDGAAFTNGLLYIRYDSMKLGLKNIEHAIMAAGFDANDFLGAEKAR